MVVVTDPDKYTLHGFEIDHGHTHKYIAIIKRKETGQLKRVPFGGKREDGSPYYHYKDNVLGYYSRYDHYDEQRRRLYQARHRETAKHKYSSSWFSWHFLW